MSKADNIIKAVKAGKKSVEEIFEESPEVVQKIIRGLKGESDDAVSSLGSGKNLDALQRAKVSAPSMDAPAYPKNLGQDDLGIKPIKPEVSDPGFTMPDPNAGLPAVRNNGLPEVMPASPSSKILNNLDEVDIPDASVRAPRYETQAPASSLGATADALKGTMDDAFNPGMSNIKKGLIGAGAITTGLGVNSLFNENPQATSQNAPLSPQQAAALVPQQKAPVSPTAVSQAGGVPKGSQNNSPSQIAAPVEQQAEPAMGPESYLDLMKQAQDGQNQQALINNMLMAGTTIGSAFAGQKPDYTAVNALRGQEGQGVANLTQQMKTTKDETELNDEKKLRDPNSDVSKAFRSALAKLGVPHTAKTSAQDAKSMGINVQNLMMQDRALEKQMAMLGVKEKKEKDAFVTGAQKSLMKPYQQYQKVASAKASLDGYLKGESSGPKDVAILYDFIKGLDPDSAVKEGEIQLGRSAMSLFEQYGISAKKLTRSDILSPTFRTAIADIMKSKEAQARSNYEEIAQPFKLQGASRGLEEVDYGKFDYLSAADAKRALGQNPESVVPANIPTNNGMVRVTRISDGASKMMSAEAAAKADPSKYTIGQ